MYCSFSFFWQHLEGQQPGQQQQQLKHVHITSKTTKPMIKAPTNKMKLDSAARTSAIAWAEFPFIESWIA